MRTKKGREKKLTVKVDILPDNGALCLVVLVHGDLDLAALDVPAADASDKVLKLGAGQVKPRLEDGLVDLADGLADGRRNADAHQLLEARDVGNQVGVQVIRVERRPEGSVVGALEQVAQLVELLHRLGKGRVACCGVVRRRRQRRQRVPGQQRQTQGEVGTGEDGQRLDEDVGDGLIARKVRVELVAAAAWSARFLDTSCCV